MISEFQADNVDTILDEDGASSDWIEIYNPAGTAVNLAGMSLTDDPLVLQKWVFPSISVAARSRLLVWASVKNRTNPAAPLHTNFDLAAGGEYLALVAADGTTKLTEFNTYPAQPPGRSYGSTNLIVVGRNGRPIYEARVTVIPDETNVVMVTRGMATARLDCSPLCRRRPDISDDSSAFTQTNEQIAARTSQASGAQ